MSRPRRAVTFGRRCIPGRGVARRLHTPGMRPARALRAGRIAALGVNRTSGTQHLRVATVQADSRLTCSAGLSSRSATNFRVAEVGPEVSWQQVVKPAELVREVLTTRSSGLG